MSGKFPMVPLGSVVRPVERLEPVIAGKLYRQIGVRLWGEGAYKREAIDGSQTRYQTLSLVETNDIIVNKIWARNGSVAVVTKELAGCYGSGEFPTFIPDFASLLPRWFHWLTKTRGFWTQCDEKSQGTSGKNRIRPEQFLKVEIPLPPLEEQRRIVARIEELAVRIEEARGLRREAVEEASMIGRSFARKLIDGVCEGLSELRIWLDPKRDGVQTGPFGAQLSASDFTDSGVPVLTIGNVQYDGLKLYDLKHVSTEKAMQLSRFLIKEGDILFARMGTVGRCCVIPPEAEGWLFNYHIIRVALDRTRVEPRYIHWSIQASSDIEAYLSEKIRGATRQGVNSTIVGSLPVRVPALEEQRRIVAYLDDLQARVDALKQLQGETQAELDALLPAVLDKAFRGELV